MRQATQRYLIEKDFLLDPQAPSKLRGASFLERVTRTIPKCLAAWADRYRVRHKIRPLPTINREGTLPADISARHALFDEAVDSFLRIPEPRLRGIEYLCLDLYEDGNLILNAADGILESILQVSPERFAILQNCWERNDLPRDLFYPADQSHAMIEEAEINGQIISRPRIYTPRQWERRSGEC